MERVIFTGMQILHDDKWIADHALVVEGKKIHSLIPADMIKHHLPAKQYHFSNTHYLIPGLIDLHIHGLQGFDVMDANEEALLQICLGLAKEGVTGFLATTMTAETRQIKKVLEAIKSFVPCDEGASILGVHLEGPFIAKSKKGAHRGKAVRLPDPKLVSKWQTVSNQMIKRVTLAPELPGAIDFIKAMKDLNITVSIGHTNATYDQTLLAIEAGAKQATHLFNAMRGIHQREPGALLALLLSDVAAELIVDGLHVHPAMIKFAYRLKSKERILLVTDSIRAKCLGNGEYELGGQQIYVNNGVASLKDGTLAGSVLQMPQAIANMATFTQCSLIDAIKMASYYPACALQLDAHKGSIDVGKDADLVVLNAQLEVLLTLREGKEVFSS